MIIIISLLIAGIVISGAMAIKTGHEERQSENEWIEKEGLKYINRMNEEKSKKLENTTNEAS